MKKILAFSLIILLAFPVPAHAFDAAALVPYLVQIQESLAPLATLVQQGIQNYNQLMQQTGVLGQLQQGIKMIQDIQTYQMQQQNGASAEEYIEYQDYKNQQRANNQRLAQDVGSYGIFSTYIRLNANADMQTVGWDSVESFLAILSALDNRTLATTMQFDWDRLELTIQQWEWEEGALAQKRIDEIQKHSNDYLAKKTLPVASNSQQPTGNISSNTGGTNSTTGTTPPTQIYDKTKTENTIQQIKTDSKTQLQKLRAIREKVILIKQALWAYKSGQYNKAIIDANKVMEQKKIKQNNGYYFEDALGVTHP